jgi:hypothetical protein
MQPGTDGPAVVIAHGFAGSRQMMQAYALSLARAGYRAYAFDFYGHGRHSVPMSGDVTAIDGTTRLLVEQTLSVIDGIEPGPRPVALLGHSMATDILVRTALGDARVGPLVLLSAFSEAITPETPPDMLLVTGAWEPGLREFARTAADETEVPRRAVIAPRADHVSILHSRVGQRAMLDWLGAYYGRPGTVDIPNTGWALLGLLGGIVALFVPLMRLVREIDWPAAPRPGRRVVAAIVLPALAAPALAWLIDLALLPVLVADYLAVHLAIYGTLQLALLRWAGFAAGRVHWPTLALLLLWGLAIFGLALDRYGANFLPTADRLWIIAILAVGAVPFMLADAILTAGAGLGLRVAARAAFLGSLAIAVALDFEGLFFLAMIAPVILLFYLVFGLMGRAAARRTGPAAAGLALGLILAWALGVSFPLFAANGG